MKKSPVSTRPTFQTFLSPRSCKAALAVAIALIAVPSVQAASFNWVGSVDGGDWNTGANWGGTAPNASTATVTIGTLTSGSAINLSSSATIDTLTLSSTNPMSFKATAGQTLTFGGLGSNTIINTSGGVSANKTIDADIILAMGGWGANVSVATGNTLTINGAITNSGVTYRQFVANGNGKLVLSNASNSIPQLLITSGEVVVTNVGAIGGGWDTKIGQGSSVATLTYTGGTASYGNRFILASRSGSVLNSSGSGELTLTNSIFNDQTSISSVGTNFVLGGSNNGTIAGKIQDNLGTSPVVNVSKSGAGTWTLGGANTYTGTTIVTEGRLNVNGSLMAASAVSVTNATLGGSGTANGSVTVTNGTIDGNGLNLIGATSFSGASTLSGLSTATSGYEVTSGTLSVTGTTTSAVTVSSGVLQGTGKVGNVAVSGTLGGTLSTGVISGFGAVSPGNSPGILTATSVDISNGIDFDFEFTLANTSPIYSDANASGNDILRLTSATPFSGVLNDNNAINIYLASATSNDTYLGGFFTSLSAEDLLTAIQGAKITYYVEDAATGAFSFNNNQYSLLDSSNIVLSATSVTGANFSGGNADGSELLIAVVPEPATWAMLVGGFGMLMGCQKLRRRSSK